MATISSPGMGSGLDVNSIVTQLWRIERKPIDATCRRKRRRSRHKLSSYGLLQSYTVNVQTPRPQLAKPALWTADHGHSQRQHQRSRRRPAPPRCPATTRVEVTQLAQAQALASGQYAASTDPVGTGTLHIELGAWDGRRRALHAADAAPPRSTFRSTSAKTRWTTCATRSTRPTPASRASIVRDSGGAAPGAALQCDRAQQSMRISAVPADPPATRRRPDLERPGVRPPAGSATMTQTQAAQGRCGDGQRPAGHLGDQHAGQRGRRRDPDPAQTTAAGKPVQVTVGVDSESHEEGLERLRQGLHRHQQVHRRADQVRPRQEGGLATAGRQRDA